MPLFYAYLLSACNKRYDGGLIAMIHRMLHWLKIAQKGSKIIN